MSVLTFHKMHGTGNDFVLFGPDIQPEHLKPEAIRFLCDRHFGVGADGVLFVCPSERGVARMRMFNPDGSEAQMCGNGIRCFAKYVSDSGAQREEMLSVESKVGLHRCRLFKGADGRVAEVEVGMGQPSYARSAVGMRGDEPFVAQSVENEHGSFTGTAVSMGNPHFVIFDYKSIPEAERLGPSLESHPQFPERTNVEFVEVAGDQHLKVTVFERGAGITLACGTGACATVAAAAIEKRIDPARPVAVDLPGGRLTIRFDAESGEILMRGPAAYVFEGKIDVKTEGS